MTQDIRDENPAGTASDHGRRDILAINQMVRAKAEANRKRPINLPAVTPKPAKKAESLVKAAKLTGRGTPAASTVEQVRRPSPSPGSHMAKTMNYNEFTETSVYTILHSKDLAALYRKGKRGMFTEGKKWVRAQELLESGRRNGQSVLVIFAPGEDIWELTHFGVLENVKISEDTNGKCETEVTVGNLTRIPTPRPSKTELIVCSTGKGLPPNHIRPYVLVQTPSFLSRKSKKKRKKK
jgi:hypothetical protein